MKKYVIIVAIAIAMFSEACGSQPRQESESVVQDITTVAESESEETEEQAESNLPEYAGVGQIVSGDKWSIALLYAKEYDSLSSQVYTETPSEGNKFLALFFDIKNISSQDDYFNTWYFEAYADDYSVDSVITLNNPDDMSSVGGDIDSGKMSKGVIVYEIPEDWKEFEISYKDGLWTTHKEATFVIEKSDISPSDYIQEGSVYEKYAFDESKKTDIGSEMGDSNWSIKLLNVKKIEETGGVLSEKADSGKEFVIFFLEAKNVSDEDDYFNALYFRSYVDGYLARAETLVSDIDGEKAIGGDVAKGKITKGYLAVQVDKAWESIELIYDDGAISGNKVAEFAITNE